MRGLRGAKLSSKKPCNPVSGGPGGRVSSPGDAAHCQVDLPRHDGPRQITPPTLRSTSREEMFRHGQKAKKGEINFANITAARHVRPFPQDGKPRSSKLTSEE